MPVHAAIAGVGIGHYSQRRRQSTSEERLYGFGGGASPSRHAALFVLGIVSPVPPQQYTVHFAGGLYVDLNFFPYSGYVVAAPQRTA